jgi:hypothetical protein
MLSQLVSDRPASSRFGRSGRPSEGTTATACNCVRRSGTGLLARMLALRDRGARAVEGVVVGTRSDAPGQVS